jgi:hypothetical protein
VNWLYRLWLGLPARTCDVEDIRKTAPEILEEGEPIPGFFDVPPWLWRVINAKLVESSDFDLRKAVKRWIGRLAEAPAPAQPPSASAAACPLRECPLKIRDGTADEPAEHEDSGVVITELMRLGGGPRRKPPLDHFLYVVGQVHAGVGPALSVIVTDPYILRDRGEAGVGGGFDNLCKYLSRLQLDEKSKFRFIMAPSPKGAAGKTKWEEAFKERYSDATIDYFDRDLVFHDRFYVVKHDRGSWKGVFGPSLNGLGAKDIALVGEIEMNGALDVLTKMLD